MELADFRCPTLWLAGSEDPNALASIKEYEGLLKESQVQLHIVEVLDHEQLFDEIYVVLPTMLVFTTSSIELLGHLR